MPAKPRFQLKRVLRGRFRHVYAANRAKAYKYKLVSGEGVELQRAEMTTDQANKLNGFMGDFYGWECYEKKDQPQMQLWP